MKKKKVITLILIVLWMGLVFLLSNQVSEESSGLSEKITNIVIKIFNIQIKELEDFLKIEMIIRKLAHFTLYGLGGILIFIHMNLYGINIKNKMIFTQLIGTTYAITDEIHQIFIEGRSGEIKDVLIDSAGVFTGIIFILIILKIINKMKKEGSKVGE